MFAKYKKGIITLIVIILAFILYSTYLKPDESDGELLGRDAPERVEIIGQDIIQELNRINSIKLDASVFSSPVLNNLQDKSEPINPEPTGRRNPFAPYTGAPEVIEDIPDEVADDTDVEGGEEEA